MHVYGTCANALHRLATPKKHDVNTPEGMREYIESLTSVCSCNVKIRVVKLAPNKYYVGERDCVIHVRLLPLYCFVWGPSYPPG